MMTLHDTIEMTKKVLLFGVIGTIGIFFLIMLFRFGGFLKEQFFPTPPPAPLTAFGKLPAITFPENTQESDFTYEIDTLTGKLPLLPDRVNVYKVNEPLPEFYDLTRAKTKARNMNFVGAPFPISENVYQWSDTADLQRKLIMNVVNKSFTLTSNYTIYQPILSSEGITDVATATEKAKGFFDAVGSFPENINEASTSAKTLTIQNGNLVETTSLQNAQIIRVDFYQSEVDALPLYYPAYPNSLIYALVANGPTGLMVVEAHFSDQQISDEFSDYPTKTAEQAFTELKEGKGHIAAYFGNQKNIKIKNVTLGYYVSEEPQAYLMPIVVFTAEDGFTAYVPALSDQVIK